MKVRLNWGIVILALVVTACGGMKKKGTASKPNILFILVDDLGWTDIGEFGSSFYETPNVDALTKKGMKFTSAYAACPVCSPTRASILTGKYPARTSTTDWFGAPQPETVGKHWTKDKPLLPAPYNEFMALEEQTLAETFKANGYSTFFAGKWHLGDEGYYPEDQGFDINKGGYHAGSPRGNHYFTPYNNPKLQDGPPNENLTNRLADETISFIEQAGNKPFLAYLSFYSVHTPLGAPQDLIDKYTEKKKRLALDDAWGKQGNNKVRLNQCLPVYGAMVESMDNAVGKVLKTLKEKNLDQNTIVVFMSDNGGLSTSEGHPTSNLPLKAGKGWLYEGGVREPMVIFWPGVTKAGIQTDQYVVSTDFYPTLLEMAGLPLLPEQHVDGKSMVPLLQGEKMDRGAVFWHYPHYGNQGSSPGSSVRLGDWKLIQWFEKGREMELYNLKNDLGENNNLAASNPEKVQELLKLLDDWRKETGARMPSENPNSAAMTGR
ncbi:arylsulfatase A-like enzyme [Dyadobacter jejuensis]|uniref:Arylsulfatase A-like enzyme n=1 Tax=Dyadobacter jejuensis TaxID=1082580 RepID=A0A316A9F2_9BACT|nr:sulfatase [Dyadobacter jejuensis]PWJ54263.1 arylsulfatase A-like enzyme [Dyadobacter jejuensis]